MPTPCLVLAVLLLTHDGGGGCAPRPLGDAALDQVTAGSAQQVAASVQQGGGVVAGSAHATTVSNLAVTVGADAQRGSHALNVVNAAASATAVGVNVWQGQNQFDRSALTQRNVVEQDQRRTATLGSFVAEGGGFSERAESRRTTSLTAHIEPTSLHLDEQQSGEIDKDAGLEKRTDIKIGAGFAAAGVLDAHVDAGAVDFAVEVEASFTLTTTGCFLFWCLSKTTTGGGHATISGEASVGELSMRVADGVLCASILASCSATGTAATEETMRRTVTTPARLTSATAEQIVVGDATSHVETNSAVSLGDRAQQAVRAMNLLNASHSAVAGAINVTGGVSPHTVQRNQVIQER